MGFIKRLKIGNFLREILVVMIGVAATLYAGNLINNSKEKKDLKNYLNAIYSELQENLEILDEAIVFYNKHENFRKFLTENMDNPQTISFDSLSKYSNIVGQTTIFIYKRSVYDMFVNSGLMKVLNNKNLLFDITECYSLLEGTKMEHQDYMADKKKELINIFDSEIEELVQLGFIDLRNPRFKRLYNFYVGVSTFYLYPQKAKKQIEKVLSEMNE